MDNEILHENLPMSRIDPVVIYTQIFNGNEEEALDASEQNVINHATCIHMILEDGEESGNIIAETYERVSEWCKENRWQQVKEVYINMLLISENAGRIRSYLELYGPVTPIKEI